MTSGGHKHHNLCLELLMAYVMIDWWKTCAQAILNANDFHVSKQRKNRFFFQ